MAVSSLGDLATSILFRGHNARLHSEMENLVQELASGQVSIQDTSLGGSYRAISGIERTLTRLDAYDLAATEASGFTDAVQNSLGAIQESVEQLSVELLTAGSSGTAAHARALSSGAVQDFEAAVSRLNSNYAGRSLFGGTATDTPALANATEMLSTLELAVAGETTAAGVATVIETWFASGGGFDTDGYIGSSQSLAPLALGSGRTVSVDVTAADDEIRDVLAGLAMAALIESGPMVDSPDDQIALAKRSGEVLLAANQDLLTTRAQVGARQEAIDQAKTEAISERFAMDFALSELLAVDPYERATQLEQVETQIEMLYALTVRTSNLKLTNYL